MFLDEDFLLNTQTAMNLYHGTAAVCPIIDYHCHIDPREIWENRRYDNITQIWLGGDHYKWRLMRAAGTAERSITGDASDHEKFLAWAAVLGRAIGNPLYHWSHLELRRYFGYEGILCEDTAQEVWELCNEKLREDDYSVRSLIRRSNVETICTTDDPADSLQWHEKLAADDTFQTAVLPAWRPDRAMNLESDDWREYLKLLESAACVRIDSFEALKEALKRRMVYFHAHGCRLSDHGLNRLEYTPGNENDAEFIFQKCLAGGRLSYTEANQFRSILLAYLAGEYRRLGWVMQIHYGCLRNINGPMFRRLGPNTGFDCVDNGSSSADLADFLGALAEKGSLPKTILYSLDANDNAAIDTIAGCFQNGEAAGYVQHGCAWWFNDHLDGMIAQLRSLAALGYLPGFIGMLTDSRSFLSYPRHEYFRRILCRVIGEWVEEGMYPGDMKTLSEIVRAVSYENARRYILNK